MKVIDLNCDMGESFGAYTIGNDEGILDYITSANIACGFHAGDPATMKKTVRKAMEKNVGLGAHPGLQDLVGYGRREMDISPEEVYDIVVYQIGALYGFVKSEGGKLQHVKPHGALYNMAARSASLSEAIAEAVYKIDPELILFGLYGGELVTAGKKIGLRTAKEVFSDRTYQDTGKLTPRKEVSAIISDKDKAARQVIRMVRESKVMSLQGADVPIEAETICIHGDHDNSLDFASYLSKALREAGIEVSAISKFLK
ncbi:LamB/YcsF family protein [Sporosarcina ureilytica]|uniref:5-oxoprolinase subunit A n=1 Tax=Sporosarcina ureilytica TaxID=298596 RepID=A0A1D8JF97_9BACL|nr:5-oxoprolinase subunit PxpA [Sporosarcina ureilytica]AOV07386.1 lactam utilization protein LamB [Sporosarcina ureilytica]